MNVQNILVPLDFSSDADLALDDALGLAQRFQARMTLLHVIYLPVTTEVNLASYFTQMEAEAQQGMETYKKKVTDAGLSVDTVIVSGVPFREIVETAKAKQADLIVMGTHGRTGMNHFLIGSVAERVVRLAPCPVMVSRETQNQEAS
ncbi:MAG: universal stress protein [Gammaproteobacteria bacterium]|nr:universal stress protein [Gammaproteobacteria bacterium]